MHISKKLPQFSKTAALLIVMGKQVAEFYEAKDGEIRLLDEFSVETPRYSDREGFFMTRSPAGVIRSGAPYEAKEDKIRQDFLRELRKSLSRIDKEHQFDALYLFVPAHYHTEVAEALSKNARSKLMGVVTGTYHREHPFLLLERLQALPV